MPKTARRWLGLAGVLLAAGLPAFASASLLTTVLQALLIGTLAVSWNLVAGFAGQISLGHAAFFGIGALLTRLLWLSGGLPFAGSMLLGGLGAALFAALVGAPALRLRGIYFSIATLAIAEALRATVGVALPGVSRLPGVILAGYQLGERYFLALGVFLLAVFASYAIKTSRFGRALLALRDDEPAAAALGINTLAYKLSSFVLGAWLAGLAGGAFAFYHPGFYYSLPFEAHWTFNAVLVTFIGGLGTLTGPILATGLFVLVRDMLAAHWVDLHLILFGLLFILVVLLRPGGLVRPSQTRR